MNTRSCPHCGQTVRDDYALCPYCGTNVETGERRELDPKDEVAETSGALTGAVLMVAAYFFLGAFSILSDTMLRSTAQLPEARAQWTFWMTYGHGLTVAVPVAVTSLLYLLLRRRFPAFARGLFASFLVALVIALGAPFICGR